MLLVGLTGGIGMGKSSAAKLLAERHVPLVDTDQLARDVVAPGQPGWTQVKEAFGAEVFDQNGSLRRERLAEIVFADADKRRQLEGILHPLIRDCWLARAQEWRKEDVPVAVVVIPLLFETGAEKELDQVVCVACSEASQRRRLAERKWSPSQIDQRLSAQWPIQKKMDLAHFVIWTEPALEVHAAQWDQLLERWRGGRFRGTGQGQQRDR